MLERELALIKVTVTPERQVELIQLVTQVFGGKIIDTTDKVFVVEVTGGAEKIDAFEKLMESYGIRELVRTGRIALMRGSRTV